MKEGLKPQKHPTELMGLWHSPGHSKGAMSQPSARQGAMYPALSETWGEAAVLRGRLASPVQCELKWA